MEDMDKNEVSNNGISEDEDLIMREVIQGDVDLYYLHHYLSEIFRKGVTCPEKTLQFTLNVLTGLYSSLT